MLKRVHKSNKFRSSAASWLLLAFAVHFFSSWGLWVHQANHHTDFSGQEILHLECSHSGNSSASDNATQSYSETDHDEHCFFCHLDWLSPSVYDLENTAIISFSLEGIYNECAALRLGHATPLAPLGRAPPMTA